MVLCTLLLALKPPHVALQPRVVALLGPPPGQGSLSLGSLLLVVWALGQLFKLPCCLGTRGGRHRPIEGLAGFVSQALGLELEDCVATRSRGSRCGRSSSLRRSRMALLILSQPPSMRQVLT